ncbi:uncharacterized protein LOC124165819 [Ischnura elegans]|uniref:uncharacterized protein LOC124165819 n=1 Tax=Ischnura elegans TaxID=197161 RepID=UPI001ED86694|nr:uncharacterized protein LOC124165819 [Ischnura elegans]
MAYPWFHPLIPLLLAHCLALTPVVAPSSPAGSSPVPSEVTFGVSASATAAGAVESTAEGEGAVNGDGSPAVGPTARTSFASQTIDGAGYSTKSDEELRILPGPVNLSEHAASSDVSGLRVVPPALHVLPSQAAAEMSLEPTATPEVFVATVASASMPDADGSAPGPTHPWPPAQHHPVHHHGPKSRFGPYFEEDPDGSNVTARLGSTVRLDCKIGMLMDKTVTWLHRKGDAIHLLTVGRQTYSSDSRFSLAYRYPNNWRLQILYANKRDEGLYECQVATHPIRVRKVYLKVTAPHIRIVDENRHEVHERYFKVGSEVEFTCLATQLEERDGLPDVEEGANLTTTTPRPPKGPPRRGFFALKGAAARVLWRHGDSAITHTTSGRGVGIRVSQGGKNVALTLRIEAVTREDGGNYTCSIGTLAAATVFIHILNGELPAAVQYGVSTTPFDATSIWLQILCLYMSCKTIWR